jgi:hypothetical protein
MENLRENEIEDNMSTSPPSVGSMQIAGSNGFGHSMEFMSQAYLVNRFSEIDIQVQDSSFNQDPPLPVYLKVLKNSLEIKVLRAIELSSVFGVGSRIRRLKPYFRPPCFDQKKFGH